jgi:hypothetical protein
MSSVALDGTRSCSVADLARSTASEGRYLAGGIVRLRGDQFDGPVVFNLFFFPYPQM